MLEFYVGCEFTSVEMNVLNSTKNTEMLVQESNNVFWWQTMLIFLFTQIYVGNAQCVALFIEWPYTFEIFFVRGMSRPPKYVAQIVVQC